MKMLYLILRMAANPNESIISCDIRLIVGLGNFGKDYKNTRHNAGFWFLDSLNCEAKFSPDSRFFCEKNFLLLSNKKVLLAKPMTYMNESGKTLSALLRFYKIKPSEVLVVHDELDILPGHVRFKQGGGCAGHKGLLSIQNYLGSSDFCRLRLGIGRPSHQGQVSNFVLGIPSVREMELILDAIDFTVSHLGILFNSIESFVHLIHSRKLS